MHYSAAACRLKRSDALATRHACRSARNNRLRLAVIDRDPGFMQVLSNRLDALGWDHRALSSAVTADALVAMRLNALVVDLGDPRPRQLGVPRAGLRATPGPGRDRLHRTLVGRPARARAAARSRRLDDQAVPRRGADLRDRGGDPPPPPQRDAAARRRRSASARSRSAPTSTRPTPARQPRAHRTGVRDPAPARQSDRVLRREEIYERVWGYAMAHGDRSVDVFVRKLRQKLRTASPDWSYIHTHFGVGYRFAPEPDRAGTRAARRRACSTPTAPSSIPRSRPEPRPSALTAARAGRRRASGHRVFTLRHGSVTRLTRQRAASLADGVYASDRAGGAQASGRWRSCPTSISLGPTATR